MLSMSNEAITWVFKDAPDVPAQCIAVLFVLAERADKQGCGACPSSKTIAAWTRKSKRQVKYDLDRLADLKLIREGDQSIALRYPANRRPVVYDLAMERSQAAEVQSIAPQEDADQGVQPTAGEQPASPQQPTAPQTDADLQEDGGVQSAAPQAEDAQGCNGAQPGVQPTAAKPTTEPKAKDSSRRRSLNDGREDAMRLCIHLADRIEGNGNLRPTISQEWLTSARLLLDNDKRTEAQAHKAIDWCQASEFWRKNVMSMPKLRERYDRLRMEADDERKAQANGNGRSSAPGPDRARGWVDAGRVYGAAAEQSGREIQA